MGSRFDQCWDAVAHRIRERYSVPWERTAQSAVSAPLRRREGGKLHCIAEAMKRGLPPDFVITQASAHSAPTSGNEYKVVNWLRAAANIAQIDSVAAGYLTVDSQNRLRLPAVRQLGAGVNLNVAGQTNLLAEYALHNLSDSDFNLSGQAVSEAKVLLAAIAANFGYNPADTTGVTAEVQKLRQRGTFSGACFRSASLRFEGRPVA